MVTKESEIDKINANTSDIDLVLLFKLIWKAKWMIVGSTAFFSMLSVVIALNMKNIYQSQALLAPSSESSKSGLAAIAGGFGGLASLAGIDFSGSSVDKTTIAIELINSRYFVKNLIDKYDLLVPLMAAESWDYAENKLILNPEIYDAQRKEWTRKVTPPRTSKPSDWESYKAFKRLLSVNRDNKTGVVSVSFKHLSPHIAKNWVDLIVSEINSVMKDKEVSEANKSIKYLTEQINKTAIAEMRMVFAQLIEEQTKTIMLAEAREEYAFSVIDPPVVPEEKIYPRRALICILGAFMGAIFGVLIVFFRLFYFQYIKTGHASA